MGTAGPAKQPIEKPPALITSGFVLTAILYFLYEALAV